MTIALAYSYNNNESFVAKEVYPQNDDNTVQLGCLDAALAFAVLDFSIELGDKECVDETLEESEIAPNIISVYNNLNKVLETVRKECHEEQNMLQYVNFSK